MRTMSALTAPGFITVEEYLAGEERRDVKHEYVGGSVYAMAGASWGHNQVAGNLFGELRTHTRGGPCRVFMADMKVRLLIQGQELFYYPDIVVTCDPRETEDYFLRFPKLIIEVLSPATERVDRREKLWSYITIPTLEEYVLVAQETPAVTIYRRRADWQPETIIGLESTLLLESVGLSVPLRELYENVRGLA
jgi:Uma2 family endonuclease